MFNAALKDESFNASSSISKAMKAVNKAMLQIKNRLNRTIMFLLLMPRLCPCG